MITRSVETTQEYYENEWLFKATYFENGLDVAMFRFNSLDVMLNSIRQFYNTGRCM